MHYTFYLKEVKSFLFCVSAVGSKIEVHVRLRGKNNNNTQVALQVYNAPRVEQAKTKSVIFTFTEEQNSSKAEFRLICCSYKLNCLIKCIRRINWKCWQFPFPNMMNCWHNLSTNRYTHWTQTLLHKGMTHLLEALLFIMRLTTPMGRVLCHYHKHSNGLRCAGWNVTSGERFWGAWM